MGQLTNTKSLNLTQSKSEEVERMRWLTGPFSLFLLLIPATIQAQGMLLVTAPDQRVRLPRPNAKRTAPQPSTYQIESLEIQARLIDQIAQVQVNQTFINTGKRQLEVAFVFPLPYDGAIDRMTLMVDGKEYPAQLLDSKDARRLYESIVRKNKDPALLQWMGTGLFKTSVFPIPPGQKRTVSLRYSQLCRKKSGLTEFLFPLSTAKYTSQTVQNVNIRVTIESNDEIKNIYSPTHSLTVERPDKQHAIATYTSKNKTPKADFRLFYNSGKGKISTRLLSYRHDGDENGYFLLLASPKVSSKNNNRSKKTVIFVVDRSGSMQGKKIKQAREALKHVLNNLQDGDLFNIVAYDSEIQVFKPELQKLDLKTRSEAIAFVEGIHAGGSTNIDSALTTAFGQLTNKDQPNYIIFLTDGLPTTGVTNEMKIAENAKKNNKVRARLFAFGVGFDVNSRLIDRLVRENYGQSEYVRPNENIEESISRLYARIESPVLTNVKLKFIVDSLPTASPAAVNRIYPKGSFDLFAGEQLVVVGRYPKPGKVKVIVGGTIDGKDQEFLFAAHLVEKNADDSQSFIEKLWAVRRVGEILDKLDLKGPNTELTKELVALALRHGILTPYTSFLADENTDIYDTSTNTSSATQRLDNLKKTSGASGFLQRMAKGQFSSALQAESPQESIQDEKGLAESFGNKVELEMREGVKKNVRNIGNRSFYRQNNQWVDSTLTEEQQHNPIKVKQFSDEYFKLADRIGRTMSKYMVFDEPALINLNGQSYLIEP